MSELVAQSMLSVSERSTLEKLEDAVERGLATFVEVGRALAEISVSRLYRQEHNTFEDYCRERWGFTDRRARQLISAAEIGTIVPAANEGQARELAALKDDPKKLREVWKEATSNGSVPTAEKVREIVQSRSPTPKAEDKYTYCPTCGHRVRRDQPLTRGKQ